MYISYNNNRAFAGCNCLFKEFAENESLEVLAPKIKEILLKDSNFAFTKFEDGKRAKKYFESCCAFVYDIDNSNGKKNGSRVINDAEKYFDTTYEGEVPYIKYENIKYTLEQSGYNYIIIPSKSHLAVEKGSVDKIHIVVFLKEAFLESKNYRLAYLYVALQMGIDLRVLDTALIDDYARQIYGSNLVDDRASLYQIEIGKDFIELGDDFKSRIQRTNSAKTKAPKEKKKTIAEQKEDKANVLNGEFVPELFIYDSPPYYITQKIDPTARDESLYVLTTILGLTLTIDEEYNEFFEFFTLGLDDKDGDGFASLRDKFSNLLKTGSSTYEYKGHPGFIRAQLTKKQYRLGLEKFKEKREEIESIAVAWFGAKNKRAIHLHIENLVNEDKRRTSSYWKPFIADIVDANNDQNVYDFDNKEDLKDFLKNHCFFSYDANFEDPISKCNYQFCMFEETLDEAFKREFPTPSKVININKTSFLSSAKDGIGDVVRFLGKPLTDEMSLVLFNPRFLNCYARVNESLMRKGIVRKEDVTPISNYRIDEIDLDKDYYVCYQGQEKQTFEKYKEFAKFAGYYNVNDRRHSPKNHDLDITKFYDYIRDVFRCPKDQTRTGLNKDIFCYYLKWCREVIYGTRDNGQCVVLYSQKGGSGKSTLFEYTLKNVLGSKTFVKAPYQMGGFDSHTQDAYIHFIEEVNLDRPTTNDLKDKITGTTRLVTEKFKESHQIKSKTSYALTTNLLEGIKITHDDRRTTIIECPNDYKELKDKEELKKFDDWICNNDVYEQFLYDLLMHRFMEEDVIVNLNIPLETKAREKVIGQSGNGADTFFEAFAEKTLTVDALDLAKSGSFCEEGIAYVKKPEQPDVVWMTDSALRKIIYPEYVSNSKMSADMFKKRILAITQDSKDKKGMSITKNGRIFYYVGLTNFQKITAADLAKEAKDKSLNNKEN